MKPKEKAAELHNKFYKINEGVNLIYWEEAKECALIAVQELIESHLLLTTTQEVEPSIRCKKYWTEVKQEIEQLENK